MKKRILFALVIGMGLTFLEPLSFEHICGDGQYRPEFYGFPFIFRTDFYWLATLNAFLYWPGFLGNLVFWSLLVFPFTVLMVSETKTLRKVYKAVFIVLAAASMLISIGFIGGIAWNIRTSHQNLYGDIFEDGAGCERRLIFLSDR